MKEVVVTPADLIKYENYQSARFVKTVSATFWIFNALYLVGISLVAGPMLFTRLLDSVALGNAPVHQLVVIVAAMILPLIAMAIAYFYGLHKDDISLSEFLVGVELPVAGVLLGRSVWAHELTAFSLGLYGFMLCVAACQCYLLIRRNKDRNSLFGSSDLIITATSTLVAVGGVYLSALAIVFTSPVTVGCFVLAGYCLFFGVAAAFAFPPVIVAIPAGLFLVFLGLWGLWLSLFVPYCFVSQCAVRLKNTSDTAHKIVSVVVMLFCIVAFSQLHKQSRSDVFTLLNQNQSSETAQKELLTINKEIRHRLVDAHLAPLRYLPQDFGFSTRNPLMKIRNTLLKLLLPTLVYQGDVLRDSRRAVNEYEVFFDAPIQRAERESILAAHKNHWSPNRGLSAGLLDIGQRTVHVESQAVKVAVKQDVATITIQEVLRNRTSRRLETLQYFTLPEEAVITGLWLSDTLAEPEMFAFQVAPRGAAQQVYQEQVRAQVDPALLELVGPRQYRLRVFPILPDTPMVVTMTYKTLADASGQWPLPHLHEQRNIFWDKNTSRTVNNQAVEPDHPTQWLPRKLQQPAEIAPTDITLEYIDKNRYIYAEALPTADKFNSNRIAVLIDGSYSMANHKSSLVGSLNQLSEADLFLCKTQCVATSSDSIDDWVFYGNTQPLQQLAIFQDETLIPTATDIDYDAIFILSDGGSYELQSERDPLTLDTPVWLVELGVGVHAYQDSLIDSLRGSGGSIVQSVNQAKVSLQHKVVLENPTAISDNPEKENTAYQLAITENHIWYERPARASDHSNEQLAEIVGGLTIKQFRQSIDSTATLDSLHEIAVRHGIVSNYSSMIVLVNDAQRQRLKDLAGDDDRFDREVETGKRRAVVASAVPEPHEWALMAMALLLLLYSARKQGWTLEDLRLRNSFTHQQS